MLHSHYRCMKLRLGIATGFIPVLLKSNICDMMKICGGKGNPGIILWGTGSHIPRDRKIELNTVPECRSGGIYVFYDETLTHTPEERHFLQIMRTARILSPYSCLHKGIDRINQISQGWRKGNMLTVFSPILCREQLFESQTARVQSRLCVKQKIICKRNLRRFKDSNGWCSEVNGTTCSLIKHCWIFVFTLKLLASP